MKVCILRKSFLTAFAILVIFSSNVFAVEPIDNWHLRSPLTLHSAAYGQDLFVVVGEMGQFLVPKPGIAGF